MKKATKQKISKGLKKHYKRKSSRFDAKGVFCLGLIVFTTGFIIQTLKPLPLVADTASHTSFPEAEDRTDMRLVNAEIIRNTAHYEGYPEYATYLANLGCHEGWLESDTINDKGNYPSYSIDRGIFGINNFWHGEVTDEVAYDVYKSTRWTIGMINKGRQFEWVGDKHVKGKPNYINKCL